MKTDQLDSPFLNTAQAAHYLRMSPKALERLRVIGGGPIYRKHGGHVVYKLSDLDEWSEQQSRKKTDRDRAPSIEPEAVPSETTPARTPCTELSP